MARITVYHGTSKTWDAERPGIGQQYYFDNPPALQGFWVTTDRAEAESFISDEGRLITYKMDMIGAVNCDDDIHLDWDEDDVYNSGVTAILGAEGDENHCIHDTSILTLIAVEQAK